MKIMQSFTFAKRKTIVHPINLYILDGNQVHWDFLTDSPQELTLQDNEAVISCGIRFSHSRAKLSKPIKVTLDHDAHFSNPRLAEIVFYTRKKGQEDLKIIK